MSYHSQHLDKGVIKGVRGTVIVNSLADAFKKSTMSLVMEDFTLYGNTKYDDETYMVLAVRNGFVIARVCNALNAPGSGGNVKARLSKINNEHFYRMARSFHRVKALYRGDEAENWMEYCRFTPNVTLNAYVNEEMVVPYSLTGRFGSTVAASEMFTQCWNLTKGNRNIIAEGLEIGLQTTYYWTKKLQLTTPGVAVG